MVFAWSLTETIRFATYATGQLGIKLGWLEYLRYTLFYVLYPLGAGSEALLMYAAIPYVYISVIVQVGEKIVDSSTICRYAKAKWGPAGGYGLFGLFLWWWPGVSDVG
jgi:hypothetical protein